MKKYMPDFLEYINVFKGHNAPLTLIFLLFFTVIIFFWYTYVSSSNLTDSIVNILFNITNSIYTDFLNPNSSQGLNIALSNVPTITHRITKYLHLLSQIFIIIGVISVIFFKFKKFNFKPLFILFSIANLVILFFAIFIPYFASSLNTTRLYQITLIFLSPFVIIGGIKCLEILFRSLKIKSVNSKTTLKLMAIFTIVFFLFNIGFVYEITGDDPTSIALSQNKININGSLENKANLYNIIMPEKDVYGAEWLKYHKIDLLIYSSYNDNIRAHTLSSYGMIPQKLTYRLNQVNIKPKNNSYVYLQSFNVNYHYGMNFKNGTFTVYNFSVSYQYIQQGNEIYDNGGSEIYYI